MLSSSHAVNPSTEPNDTHPHSELSAAAPDSATASANIFTEAGGTSSDVVQEYLQLFRASSPDTLRGSLQDAEDAIEIDFQQAQAFWQTLKLERSRNGRDPQLVNTVGSLDTQVGENGAISEAMRQLLKEAEANRSQEVASRPKKSIEVLAQSNEEAQLREGSKELAAQARQNTGNKKDKSLKRSQGDPRRQMMKKAAKDRKSASRQQGFRSVLGAKHSMALESDEVMDTALGRTPSRFPGPSAKELY